MTMPTRDTLTRFLFESLAIRGEIVHLDATWRAVLSRRNYPPAIRRVLGEAMAATALLSATVKIDGLLSLQLQGKGPLSLLLVQCTSEGGLRGLARWQGSVDEASLNCLSDGGILAINIEPRRGQERYQGVVDLVGSSLGPALEHYFRHSEQLATRLVLAASEQSAAGMLLQRLPGEVAEPDAWKRIQSLGATLNAAELLELEAPGIIRRLFHEETVRLFEPRPLSFRCTCSRERTARMLVSLGYDEVKDILASQDEVRVGCEFCGNSYDFDPQEIEMLFAVHMQPPVPGTRH
jgi:molecular chaperone Hsp33